MDKGLMKLKNMTIEFRQLADCAGSMVVLLLLMSATIGDKGPAELLAGNGGRG